MEATRQFRGISRRLAVQYLENLGGERVAEGDGGDGDGGSSEGSDEYRVEGDDWTATLTEETVPVAGSIELTEVTVAFRGEADSLEPLIEAFARKAMRAGG